MFARSPVVTVRGGMAALRLNVSDRSAVCAGFPTRRARPSLARARPAIVRLRRFGDACGTPRLDRISLRLLACSPVWPRSCSRHRRHRLAGVRYRASHRHRRRHAFGHRGLARRADRPHAALALGTEQSEMSHGASGRATRRLCSCFTRRAIARDAAGCGAAPSRPNNAAAWVRADRVLLRPTRWRIVVALGARTISVYHDGDLRRRFHVVVGAPETPTPRGLFSIVGVCAGTPPTSSARTSCPITAHSNVLQEFGGGDGRMGVHRPRRRRPAGSARFCSHHGCIRTVERSDQLDRPHGGADGLSGVPVRVR